MAQFNVPLALAAGLILMAENERAAAAQAVGDTVQKLRFKMDSLTCNLNLLLDMVLGGKLTQDEYVQKKFVIINDKKVIQDKLAAFARQGAKHNSGTSVNRFEPEINFYREAVHVGELAESGKAEENREKLKKIGSNFRIGRRRVNIQ